MIVLLTFLPKLRFIFYTVFNGCGFRWRRLWLLHTELFLCDFNVLASFTVFICFDFCTSDLRSSCCLRMSSLYDVFVLRSVDISLFSIWSTYKPVVAGYTSRHCFATVQSAKIRRCDDTGDYTVWPVTPPW